MWFIASHRAFFLISYFNILENENRKSKVQVVRKWSATKIEISALDVLTIKRTIVKTSNTHHCPLWNGCTLLLKIDTAEWITSNLLPESNQTNKSEQTKKWIRKKTDSRYLTRCHPSNANNDQRAMPRLVHFTMNQIKSNVQTYSL